MPRASENRVKRALSPGPPRRSKRIRESRTSSPNDLTTHTAAASGSDLEDNTSIAEQDSATDSSEYESDFEGCGPDSSVEILDDELEKSEEEFDNEGESFEASEVFEFESQELEEEDLDLNTIEWQEEEEAAAHTTNAEECRFLERLRSCLGALKEKAEIQLEDSDSPKYMIYGIARLLSSNSLEVLLDRAATGVRRENRRILGLEEINHKDLLRISAEETGRCGIYVNVVLNNALKSGYELYVGSPSSRGGVRGTDAGLSGRWKDHRRLIDKELEKLQEQKKTRKGKRKESKVLLHYQVAEAKGARSNFRMLSSWPRLFTIESAKCFAPFALLMEGVYMFILNTCQSARTQEVGMFGRLLPEYRSESKGKYNHQGLNRSFPSCRPLVPSPRLQVKADEFSKSYLAPRILGNKTICKLSFLDDVSRKLQEMDITIAPITIYHWWQAYIKTNNILITKKSAG
jgi:hypothetical protein